MSTTHNLNPLTPVIVGVGQFTEGVGDPNYQALSAVGIAARAALAAFGDTGADTAVIASAIDTVAGIRQFEASTPGALAPLGKSNNYPRAVAQRVGANPKRAILEVSGGQGPQHLVTELSRSILAGNSSVALIFGSEAMSTVRHLAKAENRPDFNEEIDGDLEDRGFGLKGLITMSAVAHGLTDAPSQYALFENARRARLQQSRNEYARGMGELFSPFTRVAASNPFAAAPTARTADELVEPTERNRLIADPYTRFVVARDQVNQGAAVLIMSLRAALDLGVPEDKWVFLHGHADLRERDLLDRQDLSASPAAVMASKHALGVAGLDAAELATIDLYSCFPIAVSNVADGLGLSADDPRGLTLTGGLPYFGGAGNNYSMHAIAETIDRCRKEPGAMGFVGANGGTLSKYSVGIYSTTPTEWQQDRSAQLQIEIDDWPAVPIADQADGWATIETYTVKYSKNGARTGIVIGRLATTGERFIATGVDGDNDILSLLSEEEPIGQRVYARSFGYGNRVTTTDSRMRVLLPSKTPTLREDYDHILVHRDGHRLEITINRPEARNALFPPAHEELAEIFDAYFADPTLWVAIITGAGEQAFSAGNDLIYSATGKPNYLPTSGFAGLTSRRAMNKPVIAAVNGFAMGGGLETALACHLVVVDENAQLALSEVKVGLIAGAGGLVRLPRTIPPKLANELILTGRRMGAREALDHGLANLIAPTGKALDAARELADEIIVNSPTSVRLSLEVMEQTEGIADTVDAVTARMRAIDDLMTSEDMTEGLTAFAQKRPPRWRNR
ncbi:acetyl-CoA C-acetyltransferase [Rhodococcus erythropolis]|nr:acetyl-CoA acetyltransferase [Rhodococcus erythropolis]MCW2295471.1 acetyl-CoA C-acetyltransferase [Rhodococcus erythropolis]